LQSRYAGKTSFLRRACSDVFDYRYEETPAIEILHSTLTDPTGITPSVQVSFWDCGAAALSGGHVGRLLDHASAVLLLYDITSAESFAAATTLYYSQAKQRCPRAFIMIIACKADLEHSRAVPLAEGEAFAAAHSAFFMETSAADGTNIDLTLTILRIRLAHALSKGPLPGNPNKRYPMYCNSTQIKTVALIKTRNQCEARPLPILRCRYQVLSLHCVLIHLHQALWSKDRCPRPHPQQRHSMRL